MKPLFIISAIIVSFTASAQKVTVSYVTDATTKAKVDARKSAGDSARKYAAQYTAPLSKAQKDMQAAFEKQFKLYATNFDLLGEALADSMKSLPVMVKETLLPKDSTYKNFVLTYEPVQDAFMQVEVSNDGEFFQPYGDNQYRFLKTIPERLVTVKPWRFVRIRYTKQ